MDYQLIFGYSNNLHVLNQVCGEFYEVLQNKAFWREKSRKENIEPEITCLRDWLKHTKAQKFSLQEESFSIIVDKSSLSQETLKDVEKVGLNASNIQRVQVTLQKEESSWLISFVAKTNLGPIYFSKRVNAQEREKFVYPIKRGLQTKITFCS